jgi:hypothetical protein
MIMVVLSVLSVIVICARVFMDRMSRTLAKMIAFRDLRSESGVARCELTWVKVKEGNTSSLIGLMGEVLELSGWNS